MITRKKKTKPALWLTLPNAKANVIKKKPIFIRGMSKKMTKTSRQYGKLRRQFLEKNPLCQACPVINPEKKVALATDIHHKRGRGKFHVELSTWMGVCRNCHRWMHDNVKKATELGFHLPRR